MIFVSRNYHRRNSSIFSNLKKLNTGKAIGSPIKISTLKISLCSNALMFSMTKKKS